VSCLRPKESTYNLFQPKELFTLLRQVHVTDGKLPAPVTPSDFCAQCTAHDLVSEADPKYTHPILRQDPLREFYQAVDPRDVFKRIML